MKVACPAMACCNMPFDQLATTLHLKGEVRESFDQVEPFVPHITLAVSFSAWRIVTGLPVVFPFAAWPRSEETGTQEGSEQTACVAPAVADK